MTITGLDISPYQENPPYNQFINWQELKADPLNFRFIWIKCSEGTDDTGYIETAARQVAGAKSVNFEAINPYHYYLYQWYSVEAGKWNVLSATEQAAAFYAASKAAGFPTHHPMTDIEDPLVGQFLQWHDTPTANAALAFAKKLNAHLKSYHEEIMRLFGVRPDIYTGAWWWDRMGSLLLSYAPGECAWWADYKFILADYDGSLNYPLGIPASQVIAWQLTSTPVPPVRGIPTGHSTPGDALDIDVWMQSDEEFRIWAGQGENSTMASIHNQLTPQADRAKILTLKGNQKITVTPANLSADAVILEMGGTDLWENGHMKLFVKDNFAARCDLYAETMPVIGNFKLNVRWFSENDVDLDALRAWQLENNRVLNAVIQGWCAEAVNWDKILAGTAKWHPLSALRIEMTDTDWYQDQTAVSLWQAAGLLCIIEKIKSLQGAGKIPTIPVILYTGPWWLAMYDKDEFEIQVLQSEAYKSWLWLELGQWVRTSTATFDDLAAIFAFPPEDTFIFKSGLYTYPEGYFKRIIAHEFTGQAQKCKTVTDAAGNPTAVNLSLWCDTPAEMYEFLGFEAGTTPPEEPPVEPPLSELENKVKALEAAFIAQGAIIIDQGEKLAILSAWKKSFIGWLELAPFVDVLNWLAKLPK